MRYCAPRDSNGTAPRRATLAILGVALALVLPTAAAFAGEPQYLGVGSCSSSTCHGAIVARDNSRVAQNEYRIWTRKDLHSKAYATLATKESQRIAAVLGLASAAGAAECLACHSIQVSQDRRSPTFNIKDGVGCEACHGASSEWIKTHQVAGVSRREVIDNNGLKELDDPATRARTCLPCHQGSQDRAVTHRMMAAGHPRLSFELDTFTFLQPGHYVVDKDYRERGKIAVDSVTAWATGQAASVGNYLTALADDAENRADGWPDFALYDCFSCHHDIGTQLSESGPAPGAQLGLPRLALPALPLYRSLVELSGSAAVTELDTTTADLRAALPTGGPPLQRAAEALAKQANANAMRFARHEFDQSELMKLLASLSSASTVREYRTYADAEQATMACQALVSTLSKLVPAARAETLKKAVAGLFAATESEGDFRASRFRTAMEQLQLAL